ncbi:Apolipoprotein N-acyltransferase [Mycobacterium basiliense]|uniref:Apolipoprotein N-acyltransferase n=1 Tax=Mycobacterium basiliense TaxID=2094119 RepID=A0A3S4BGG0_9MYCO|nr:Apolipoprotein N-acyltransferase [Mycobacterium basiliense]
MARHWSARRARHIDADQLKPETQEPNPDPHADPDRRADAVADNDADAAEASADAPEPVQEPTVPQTAASPSVIARLGAAARWSLAAAGTAVGARLPGVWAALRPRLTRLGASVAAGLLMYASFPPIDWWWAAVLSIALLTWVVVYPATSPAGGLGYGFVFGMWFYVPLLPWIGTLVGPMPWLVLATTSALFPAVFGLFAVLVRGLRGWPIWFAVLWGAQEWLKSIVPFGGFPWGSVAFGQADGPLLPLVQLGGVALLSTGVVLIGCSFTAIAFEIEKWWRTGQRAGDDASAAAKPPAVVLPGVCICLVLFTAVIVWPQVRHAGAGSGGEPTITVAVVQGNVPRLGLDFNSQRRVVLDNHVHETLQLAEDVRAGLAPQPQFVIWPEDSSDIDPLVNPDAAQQISKAALAIGAPILVGTVLDVPGSRQDKPEFTNTVIVWNPGTGPADRHDKEIVQPFGEYLPMPWLFQHLSGYANRAGNFVPRAGSGVVRIAGVPVGVSTCWEVIFDRAPRKAVRNGAQLLAVPSNNATFNQTMSEQQLAFGKVRAVEHDRYVLVAGTTGISAVIAPDGGELVRTDFFAPAYLDTQVRLKTRLTPATRWAPILQWVLVGAAGAVILVAIRHNGWSPGWSPGRSPGWLPRPTRRRSGPAGRSEESDGPLVDSDVSGAALRNESETDLATAKDPPPDVGGHHST